jgi:hypothetical protein
MRRNRFTIVMLVILSVGWLSAAGLADQPQRAELDQLAWITGSWWVEKDGVRTEEHWTSPRGGTMLGMGRTIKADRTVFFEYLRIEQTAEALTYLASPNGRVPATAFRMVEIGPDKVVFTNPENDFPTRITYWRAGDDAIGARIEGTQGGVEASQAWEFVRGGD